MDVLGKWALIVLFVIALVMVLLTVGAEIGRGADNSGVLLMSRCEGENCVTLGGGLVCEVREARRHDAWEGVFEQFPGRVDMSVDGYIATECKNLGKRYILGVGGRWYRVVVADCKNRSEAPVKGGSLDIDYRIWRHAGLDNRPVVALLCEW